MLNFRRHAKFRSKWCVHGKLPLRCDFIGFCLSIIDKKTALSIKLFVICHSFTHCLVLYTNTPMMSPSRPRPRSVVSDLCVSARSSGNHIDVGGIDIIQLKYVIQLDWKPRLRVRWCRCCRRRWGCRWIGLWQRNLRVIKKSQNYPRRSRIF